MNKLIKFELNKLAKQKSFYICIGIMLAMLFLSALISKSWTDSGNATDVIQSGFAFSISSIGGASFTMISAIFVALFICDDYTNNTLKNIYARGYSRKDVFISKYIAVIISTLIMGISCIIFSLIIGSSMWQLGSMPTNYILSLGGQLILILAYATIFFVISMVIGKTGGAIACNIVGPMIIGTVLSLGDSWIKMDNFKLNSYWLDSFMSKLTSSTLEVNVALTTMLLCIVYAGIILVVGQQLNKKKEL